MAANTVTIQAEWARWGKESHDKGYRLLECSDGVLSQEVFRTVLTRYAPGTVASVPQVTVSWLEDQDGSHHLGMAIHDHPDAARLDAADREIIQSSYYCVPFRALAAGAVSYTAMYDQFRPVRLPIPDGHPIATTLPATRFKGDPPGTPADWLAIRAAALLLTNKPVCVLRGQHASLTERLAFLDAVVALLPYGMRSQLSASTWASGTYKEHKLRLFFATAARDTDHAVTWGASSDQAPIGDDLARRYESWLKENLPGCLADLTTDTEPQGFSFNEVSSMLMRRAPRRNRYVAGALNRRSAEPGDEPVAGDLHTEITSLSSIEDLLTSCALRLRDKNPGSLRYEIDGLRKHRNSEQTDTERRRYREIITEFALLNEHPIDKAELADLYESLLRLAFSAPLTYACYRDIEMIVLGVQGTTKPLHRPLAEVIHERIKVDSFNLRLLVLNGIGPQKVSIAMRAFPLEELLRLTATMAQDPGWRNGHAFVMCANVHRYLTSNYSQAVPADRDRLRLALRECCYLAPALDRVNPTNVKYQLVVLTDLLKLSYGAKLTRAAVKDILHGPEPAPTDALFATVVRMIEPEDVSYAERAFTRNLVWKSGFDKNVREHLLRKLPEHTDQAKSSPGSQRQAPKHGKRSSTQETTIRMQTGQ